MFNVLTLSRMQFAITTIYHFLFVPLTLGLSILVALLQTQYYRTNDERYKKLTKYFGGLFLINFSMGVATGIVQEFQFGMNWSGYSKFVGDIFGAPLAIEALAAFFIESTFLGIWIFGWDKIPKKVHLASIWLVALSGCLSAFWIIVANAFMQEPTGYILRNGRAEMVDFFALIKNPQVWLQFPHTLFSAFVTGAMFMIGISAYNLLRKKDIDVFSKSMKLGVVFGLVSLFFVMGIGDAQGKYLVVHQPMKMAAAEALWESKDSAPLSLFAKIDEEKGENSFDLAVPNMLSFLSFGNFTGRVTGIHELQEQYQKQYGEGNYVPPVKISFWSFRTMVFGGSFMLLEMIVAAFLLFKKKLVKTNWFLKVLLFTIPLPYLCNSAGWMLTEIGRQPWVVYGLLKVDAGVSSSVSAGVVLTSLIGFAIVYGVLAVVDLYLIVKFIKKDVELSDTISKNQKGGIELWT
ncbi:MAG: cytochrome ubiquinol oxidase subunit I [Clostridiaceae bacterium]|nr:cytochrome ubiquinol oxidase subunit I [Clostridiaceae bacterium]